MMATTLVATRASLADMPGLLERLDAALNYAKAQHRVGSASDAAIKAGLSRGYFGKTRGDLKRDPSYDPGATTLRKIADVCGVRPNWLASGEPPMLPEQFPAAPPHMLLRDENTPWTLATFLEGFAWPEDLLPSEASEVIKRVREEFFKATEPIPQSYWHMRITRLIREVQGHAKDVHVRERPSVDPDAPDPDVEAEKARRRAKKKRS